MERAATPDPAVQDPAVPDLAASRRLVDVAAGRVPADLALRGARVLDPFTRQLRPAEVLVADRWIAAVVPEGNGAPNRPEPRRRIDLDGGVLSPGLIDGHMHLESALVAPARYAEAVLPRGVTGVVCDPHEVANVAGVAGVAWLLRRAEGLPFDVFATVPSCVPSTELETAGARLGPDEIAMLLAHPGAVGLAELMSFPAVVAGDEANLAKALSAEARRGTVEGHAPGLRGAALQAYLAAGVASDHETSELDEGLEKLRAGMFLWIREGSVARDAYALAPLLAAAHGERLGFCTDDQLPNDLLREGGVDHAVRTAVAAGAEPVAAMAAATWNAARHYRLPRRGATAPGYLADLAWWRGRLGDLDAGLVLKEGRVVARDGRVTGSFAGAPDGDAALHGTVRLPADLEARLRRALRLRDGVDADAPVPVVEVRPASLRTGAGRGTPPSRDGSLHADPAGDLALLVCAERHGKNGRVAAALVRGFGLRRGALASSVGHDHHNLMAVGAEPASIAFALRRLEALGGGLVAVEGDEVRAELALPLGGLLTDAPLVEVAGALERLDDAAARLGCRLPAPLMALSFLGLAVIPELKLTDHGLVDVTAARLVPVPWGDEPG
jgi:adenine deaminase